MNRTKIFLILSMSFISFNLHAMEEQVNVKKKVEGFIPPEDILPVLLKNKIENPSSTIVKKQIHVPLALRFKKLFKKKWYIGLGSADGSESIEPSQERFVTMAFDLFSAVYIGSERKKKHSVVTHDFLNRLNKYRDLIKQELNLTEIDVDNETSRQNEKNEIIEPKNVYEIIQQRFPHQDIDMRRMHKQILENLFISPNQDTVAVTMNESFKQPKHNKSDKRRVSFFSPASFVLGSVTTLGLIGILYVPQLYHWLRTR